MEKSIPDNRFISNNNVKSKNTVSFTKRKNQQRSGKKNKNLLHRRKFKNITSLNENETEKVKNDQIETNKSNIEPGELITKPKENSSKIKKSEEKIEKNDKPTEVKEKKTLIDKKQNNLENKDVVDKSQLLNVPDQTIFLQNVNYSTKEAELKEFFEKLAPVEYAKICKSNNISKGTAFVMFKSKKDCESILSIYEKCNNKGNDNLDSLNSLNINPFEFQGKQLKIFKAYDKNDTNFKLEKKEDRRNREYLLYGLYKHFNGDLNDMDKEKREFLMKSKKENFKNNPNLFTSKTRLTVRNFSKKLEEKDLKTFLLKNLQEWIEKIENKEERIKLIKSKKIRQIKLLRDAQTNKSKVSRF